MSVFARTRWLVTVTSAVLGVLALTHFGLRAPGLVLAALAVGPVVAVQRMRLKADASGVTVVNLLRARHVEWSEIDDFEMGVVFLSRCLGVRTRDGNRIDAWVVTDTGLAAYPAARVDSIVSDLRRRLTLANGWSQEDLVRRARERALAAADRGDYRHASTLVADHRLDPQELATELVKRSKETRPGADHENERRSGE